MIGFLRAFVAVALLALAPVSASAGSLTGVTVGADRTGSLTNPMFCVGGPTCVSPLGSYPAAGGPFVHLGDGSALNLTVGGVTKNFPAWWASLGTAATQPVGPGGVASYSDTRITGALQAAGGDGSGVNVTANPGGPSISLALLALTVPSVRSFGTLYGDGQQATYTVTVANGSTSLLASGASFAPSDVGKKIRIATSNGNLDATIAAVLSSQSVTLSTGAQIALSGVSVNVFWGHDDYPAIQAAISSGLGALLPSGNWWISQSLVYSSNQALHGPGFALATVKLMPGVNADILQASGVYSLFGTQSGTSVDNWQFDNITFDGNSANQFCSNPDTCNGLADYGAGWQIHHLRFNNVKGHGLRTDYQQYGPGGAIVDDVQTLNVGRHGWNDAGPHDVTDQDFVAVDSGQEADNTYDGWVTSRYATGKHLRMHNWHNSTATNRVAHQMYDGVGGQVIENSQYEGGRQEAYFAGNGSVCIGCKAYAPYGATTNALLVHAGNSNAWIGGTLGIADGQSFYGYQVGDSAAGLTAYGNQVVGTVLTGFSKVGAFNFSADGGYNSIFGATGSDASGGVTAFAGTPSIYSQYSYDQSGTVLHYHTPGNGNNVLLGSPTNVVGSGGAQNSVALGGSGNSTGSASAACVIAGQNLYALNFSACTIGGTNNNNNAGYGGSLGGTGAVLTGTLTGQVGTGYANDRGRYGFQNPTASGSFTSAAGTAQSGNQVIRGTGASASPIRLTADGATAGAANVVNLPASAVGSYSLRITLTALDTTTPANTYSWSVPIALLSKTGAAQSTTTLSLGTPVPLATNSWAPTVSATADTTNGGLNLSFTPPSGNTDTIHVVARVESVEVQ